jgi:hypothetical protein
VHGNNVAALDCRVDDKIIAATTAQTYRTLSWKMEKSKQSHVHVEDMDGSAHVALLEHLLVRGCVCNGLRKPEKRKAG